MRYGLYHGCHNTFVIGDYQENIDYSQEAIRLCHKNQTDGLLILKQNPLEMIFYNADGSRAPMCGNGIRCFAKYGHDLGLIKDKQFDVVTLGGLMHVEITNYNPFTVRVNLGKPSFDPKRLSIETTLNKFISQKIPVNDKMIEVSSVFMGTHHTVVFLDNLDEALNLGAPLCNHPLFKAKMNINFVKIINRDNIFVKTYERGVGWTQACGTGACSSYVISHLLNKVNDIVHVKFAGGEVIISQKDGDIYMEGPAVTIMEPRYE